MKSLVALLSPRVQPKDIEIGVAWPGKRHVLKVQNVTKVEDVKKEIEKLESILVKDQTLLFKDKKLKNHRTLAYYSIENDRTLILQLGQDDKEKSKKTNTRAAEPAKKAGSESASERGLLSPTSLASPTSVSSSSNNHHSPQVSPSPTPAPAPAPISSEAPTTAPAQRDTTATTASAQSMSTSAQSISYNDEEVYAHPGHVSELTATDAARENANDIIKILVKHGKKEYKLKLPVNSDIWAIKLQLEALKVGRATRIGLIDEQGEDLDDEGTLDDFGVQNGSELTLVERTEDNDD